MQRLTHLFARLGCASVVVLLGVSLGHAAPPLLPVCSWPFEVTGHGLTNVATPDTNATYWVMPLDTRQWQTMVVHGQYPEARFFNVTTYTATGALVDETPEVARDFMVAYILGARVYNDAIVRREPEALARVQDTTLRRTSLRDPDLLDRVEPTRIDPNGTMSRAGLAADYQWFREYGGLAETVDLDQLLDERFVEYAVAVLGPYR